MESDVPEMKMEHELEDLPPTTGKETLCFISWHFFPLCLHFSLESVGRCCFSFLSCAGRKRGAWSLVCDTEEQWLSLAESIKDKTSPQDRHLYRVISQNFLPEISNMIEHKVRHQRHHHQSPLHQHTTPSMRPLFLIGCRFVNMKVIIHRL